MKKKKRFYIGNPEFESLRGKAVLSELSPKCAELL